jgi:hypothetical protein
MIVRDETIIKQEGLYTSKLLFIGLSSEWPTPIVCVIEAMVIICELGDGEPDMAQIIIK